MRRRAFVQGGLSVLAQACMAPAPSCEPPRSLRIATNLWTGYESLYVARDRHKLPDNVRVIELLSATQVMAVMRTGAVETAALTLDEAVSLVARGVSIRVVGAFDTSAGADALIARKIERLEALRGARIGVESSALGAYFLSRVLETARLTLQDVDIVQIDVSQHEQAFRAGVVDAVITFDPVRTRLIALGGKSLFDSSLLPGEIVDVLVAQTAVLDDPAVRTALAEVLKGLSAVVRSLSPGSPIYAEMAPRLSLSAKQVEASVRNLKLYDLQDMASLLSGQKPRITQHAIAIAERMRRSGLLQQVPSLANLVDDRVLREASA